MSIADPTDYAKNLTPVLPAAICLDCSESMATHDNIVTLHTALTQFIDVVRGHAKAKRIVAWDFITFQGDEKGHPNVVAHLGRFERASDPVELPDLVAGGNTPLGEAVDLALKRLMAEKADLKQNSREYYQPWLVVMTDGMPTTPAAVLDDILARTRKLLDDKDLVVIAVGIGPHANREFLEKLSPLRQPDMIEEGQIEGYFQFLSESIIDASTDVPGSAREVPTFDPDQDGDEDD